MPPPVNHKSDDIGYSDLPFKTKKYNWPFRHIEVISNQRDAVLLENMKIRLHHLALLTVISCLPFLTHADDTNVVYTHGIKKDPGSIMDQTKDTAQNIADKGKDLAQKSEQKTGEIAGKVGDSVKNGLDKAGDAAQEAGDKIKQDAQRAGVAVQEAANIFKDKLNSTN